MPNVKELMTYASVGAIEIITFGQEGDSFARCHDIINTEDGEFRIIRKVSLISQLSFITTNIDVK